MKSFNLLFLFLGPVFCQYEVPDALIEVFKPRGLRVSIPDENGIKLFAFHGKVNEEMNGREGGTFSRDILKAKNGRWTFYDPMAELKLGDVLYYWTYVDYFDGKNKLGYTKDDQSFTVTELLEKESTGCQKSVTATSTNRTNCQGRLIFSEDFQDLKDSVWTTEIKFAGAPEYEFVLYGNHPRNLAVNNNELHIRPLPSEQLYGRGFVRKHLDLGANCTGVRGTEDCVQTPTTFLILPPVASAQINTKNKWAFKYGKIEIRAKLPSGDWIYPELFLNPQSETYGPGYASGQIRVAFIPGNSDSVRHLRGGIILGESRAGRNAEMKTISKVDGSWCDDFHRFTVVWGPEQITLSVDDTVYGNIFPPANGFASESHRLDLGHAERWRTGTKFAPFDQEMYLAIGVGVGGHTFEDRTDGSKPWKNKENKEQRKFHQAQHLWEPTWTDNSVLKVDYIKVWAL